MKIKMFFPAQNKTKKQLIIIKKKNMKLYPRKGIDMPSYQRATTNQYEKARNRTKEMDT